MTLTLPMAMIGEGGVKSGDAGREDGCQRALRRALASLFET